MKVEQAKSFMPVAITLETQEEVDAIFAVFNQTRITDALSPAFDVNTHAKLQQFRNYDNSHKYWKKLCDLMK